jgi:hypothetical protein
MSIGDLLVLSLVLLAAVVVPVLPGLSRPARTLILIGLALRIVGGQVYFAVTETIYGGAADYNTYYYHGLRYAEALFAGRPGEHGSFWLDGGVWCCTAFTIRTAGVLIGGLGLSMTGAFILFGLFGYAGILAFAVAFGRAFPGVKVERYLVWIAFFPSLWYWPAVLGKDALVLGGLGLAVLGFVGRHGRHGLLTMIAGLSLVFAIRPQVAIVLTAAFVLGHWLVAYRRPTLRRVLSGTVLAAAAVVVLVLAGETIGVNLTYTTDVEHYVQARLHGSAAGGSAIEVQGGRLAPLLGLVNVLARPLVFEHGLMARVAGIEVMTLWLLAFWRRRAIGGFFRAHQGSPVMWMALAFCVLYAVALAISVGNLGAMARLRIHLFPFLFMFFAGAGAAPLAYRAAAPVAGRAPAGPTAHSV